MKTLKLKILGLVLLIPAGVYAQDFTYGIKAGSNFAVQSEVGNIYDNNDIKIGLNTALFTTYQISENNYLQIELSYEQKGSKAENLKTNLDYLTVPVLFNYSLGKSYHTPLEFHINAGPYAAFLLKAEDEVSIEGITETRDVSADFNKTEFGLMTGLGMRYPINNKNILLDLRFGVGLTTLAKNDSEIRNKYMGVSLGYEF